MKFLNKIKSKMTAYILSGMFVTLIAVLFSSANSGLAFSGKKAEILFTETSHDFGKVEQGTLLEYSFFFTNEGNNSLVIEKVQPSCGCTGTSTDGKNEYGEGETGEIKVTFNTQGRSGNYSKTVSVNTNDPVNPVVILSFKCEVEVK